MQISLQLGKSLAIDGRIFTLSNIGEERVLIDVEQAVADRHCEGTRRAGQFPCETELRTIDEEVA